MQEYKAVVTTRMNGRYPNPARLRHHRGIDPPYARSTLRSMRKVARERTRRESDRARGKERETRRERASEQEREGERWSVRKRKAAKESLKERASV